MFFFCILWDVLHVVGVYGAGVSDEVLQCDNGTEALIGLWLDVLTFAFVVLQIIILDTRYSDQVQQNIIDIEETGEKWVPQNVSSCKQ